MAMESSKGPAHGSSANAPLPEDKADELAASFRPAWDVDDGGVAPSPPAAPAPAPAAAATAGTEPAARSVRSPTMLGLGAMRPPEPSSEAIEPENVLEVAPAPRPAAVEVAKSAPPPVPAPISPKGSNGRAHLSTEPVGAGAASAISSKQAAPMSASAPEESVGGAIKDPFAASPDAASDDDDLALVPKRSKTPLYAGIALGAVALLGLAIKLGSGGEPTKPASTAARATAPAATKEEVPPPPAKDEAPKGETAKASADTTKPEPAKLEPAKPDAPAKADPPARPEPVGKAEPPAKPEPVAKVEPVKPAPATRAATPAAPKSTPRVAPPPAPKPAAKAASTSGGGGGIVRDNPF